jgi:hypothetical protein
MPSSPVGGGGGSFGFMAGSSGVAEGVRVFVGAAITVNAAVTKPTGDRGGRIQFRISINSNKPPTAKISALTIIQGEKRS